MGRKLLSTGNGRCNLSNLHAAPAHYHGRDPDFCRYALEQFPVSSTLAYFAALGLETVTEPDGKIYPRSNMANSVLDVLRYALEHPRLHLLSGDGVADLRKKGDTFAVTFLSGERYTNIDKVILACGGAAGKKLGGSKSGYHLLSQLGHSCTELLPSLTQIKTDPTYVKALKGVRADAHVRLRKDGQTVQDSFGEVQFTDFGLSGPEAFTLSRAAATGGEDQELALYFFREYGDGALLDMLQEKRANLPALAAEDLFSGMLQSRLGKMIVKRAGLKYQTPLQSLNDEQLLACVKIAKWFTLAVEGVMGFDSAQVTAGGVSTREFDSRTLESTISPGLFVCGEVLDIDGDCGGFNLQWAWSSGYLAGRLGEGD